MSLLAERSIIKEDKSNIITLGAIAKEEKAKDNSVCNATIGMLYDEKGNLLTFKSVDKALSMLTEDEKFAYASTPGSKAFHEALMHWIFQDYYDEILKNMYCSVMATPGGSGAISNTFSNYLNPNDKALLPSYMWGNYKQFAYENYASYDTYKLFDDKGAFNLKDCCDKIDLMKKTQKRILLVINDPCQNPTGYTMTYNEWSTLTDYINLVSEDGTPFILLYDMAYIDYDKRGIDATRQNIRLFEKFNDNVIAIMAFSGSKTLALYGLRVGAMIALSKNKTNIDEFFQSNKFSSRAKWSTTTNLGMNIVTKVLTDDALRASFMEELSAARSTLTERANAFAKAALEVNLKTLPFQSGFFITIPCNNPMESYEKLKQRKIHVIPLGNVLRVTISAISLEDCKRLPKEIKECI